MHDVEIYTGDSWNPQDNFDHAMVNGNLLDYDSFIGSSGTVDTNLLDREETPGIYSVTYKLNGVESVAKVTVLENQLSIIGNNVEGYVGDAVPDDSEFKAVGLDYDGASLPVVIDKSRIDMNKAGNYIVFLTINSVDRPDFTFAHTVSVIVKEKQTAVKSHDSTIYVGDSWKAQDNFDSAVDKAGHAVDFSKVVVDSSKLNASKAGIYDVTYSYDGAVSTSKVTVLNRQTSVKSHDSTIYVGDSWKTQDNFDSAVDKSGHAVDFSKVVVDSSKLNASKAGIYDVTYSYDGAVSTSKVTVLNRQTSVKSHDSTIYVGDSWKVQDNFDSAVDKAGHAVDFSKVVVDSSKVNTSKVGVYDVTYSYDGAVSVSKVTVKDRQLITPKIDLHTSNRKVSLPKISDKSYEVKNDHLDKSSLPKTGEESGVIASVYGLFIVVIVGAAILYKKKI
ncbi:bacterial Ig-like domain-containing protein [Lactococcus lactis]|uniref:bacterial Ig-like domain-containing protein n=1 Tax=Lactococcus lactis TaxID=1358 RepID=UPI0015D5A310|nr:bacterial Ig-like domain-containing protein [Lactococcus lactis]